MFSSITANLQRTIIEIYPLWVTQYFKPSIDGSMLLEEETSATFFPSVNFFSQVFENTYMQIQNFL